jgi:glutathione S-transferase
MITVTAFQWVPDFARGQVRDLRVRWALEEAGVPYRTKLLAFGEGDGAEYRAIQPWGQVPAMQEDGEWLFESGAIVLRIAERSEALAPADPAGRSRMVQWVFAALNSVEPHLQNLAVIDFFYPDEAWAKARRPGAEDLARVKLASLARRLEGRDYLEDRFTAGDLMMASVLRIAGHTDVVRADPVLGPYLERCTARPAFRRALDAQLADFTAEPPPQFATA